MEIGKRLMCWAGSCLLAAGVFAETRCEKTATGARLLRDGKVVWNLEVDTPEGRPFFHPLTLPGGRPLTDLRPKDHVWHLGYWFSWKFINGVNYWEPADGKRQGTEPAGRTRVTRKRISFDKLSCTAELDLDYGPRAGTASVLAEHRTIVVDPPDPKGGYTITTRHRFTALADVTLDRTPPHGDVSKGKWGGGYAGATLRADAATMAAFRVRGFSGGASPSAVTGKETASVDFTDPATGEGVTFTQLKGPETGRFYLWPDSRMANASPLYTGPLSLRKGETLELAYRLAVHGDRRVKGLLAKRPVERMDRGLVAAVTPRGSHVSWRILETDAADAAFDLWRKVGDAPAERVNAEPIRQTSDLWLPGYTNAEARYSLDGKTFSSVRAVASTDRDPPQFSFPLADTNVSAQAVAVGDLDGDGAYDFVVKTPTGGTDPWDLVWHRAKDTHKLEAYTSTGRFLWRRDLGWNIEMGVWYSPYVVADLDGDGKAEVIAKTAPLAPDYRNRDGRVMDGPEYLSVLDGLTGGERARTPWIPRGAPDPARDYNHYSSRNQIAIAYLDGKTPFVIIERGTYGRMVVEAYRFTGTALERAWRFDNASLPSRFRGQGDHGCLCNDVDADGCDEILIGSLTLDHDGTVLWCSGRGHSDAHYFGDIDPERPGLELAFVYETAGKTGGLRVADPATGEPVWDLGVPTRHVHGGGICADIDPAHPGLEIYGQECNPSGGSKTNTHPKSDNRWFFAANGTHISSYTNCTFRYGNGVANAYWDGDLQREVFRDGLRDHEGAPLVPRLGHALVADLFGDWREEVVWLAKGRVGVCTTDVPAMDRRVTLMRDPAYRGRVTMRTSGYSQTPILTYVPSAVAPGLSLRVSPDARRVTLDVTAPLDAPLAGTLAFDGLPKGWRVDLGTVAIDLPPGGRWTKTLPIRRPPCPRGRFELAVTLSRPNAASLVIRQPCVF